MLSINRRRFALIGGASISCAPATYSAETPRRDHVDVTGLIGVTTGSFSRHLSATAKPGKLVMLDLPRIMRDELDLQVLDLMTATLPSTEPDYLDRLRQRAEDAGCVITNLKMNQKNVDMGSRQPDVRKHAVAVYKRSIDAAARLGCRWVRPLPRVEQPDVRAYVDSYRELIDYAGRQDISLLIENFGWIKNDAGAIPRMIAAVGNGLSASVDTGNWTDDVRYEGLARAFPHAVTCDFKAFTLGPNNEHPKYDLKRCFQIAWEAGFRGPWCFEHFHPKLDELLKGLTKLRRMIQAWVAEQGKRVE